jgi:hypothetical protein
LVPGLGTDGALLRFGSQLVRLGLGDVGVPFTTARSGAAKASM